MTESERDRGGARSVALPDLNQPVSSLPVSFQVRHHCIPFHLGNADVVLDNSLGFAAGVFEKRAVADEVSHSETRRACLLCSKEFAGPT